MSATGKQFVENVTAAGRKIRPYPTLGAGSKSASAPRGPWEIAVCGDLTDRQSDLLSRFIEVPPSSSGLVYFDSCGGSVYTGLALATLIRSRQLKVTAVVAGECSSAALLPFAASARRYVTAFSTLLFHPMRWQSEEDVRLEEATEWARHFKQLETSLDGLLARMFPIDAAKLAQWNRPGRFISGPEIAEAGLATLYDPFENSEPWKLLRP
ncbi:MAG: ATP-dependent Clp protease proteolytic subunit [Planctomycetaceae bacterium]